MPSNSELDKIEHDLAESFEQFRLAENASAATPAASKLAAQMFVRRMLAWRDREVEVAYKRGYNTGWQKSKRTHDERKLNVAADQLETLAASLRDAARAAHSSREETPDAG